MKYILLLLLCSCTLSGQIERAKTIEKIHKKFGYVEPVVTDKGLVWVYHYHIDRPTTIYSSKGYTMIKQATEEDYEISIITDTLGVIKQHHIKKAPY